MLSSENRDHVIWDWERDTERKQYYAKDGDNELTQGWKENVVQAVGRSRLISGELTVTFSHLIEYSATSILYPVYKKGKLLSG